MALSGFARNATPQTVPHSSPVRGDERDADVGRDVAAQPLRERGVGGDRRRHRGHPRRPALGHRAAEALLPRQRGARPDGVAGAAAQDDLPVVGDARDHPEVPADVLVQELERARGRGAPVRPRRHVTDRVPGRAVDPVRNHAGSVPRIGLGQSCFGSSGELTYREPRDPDVGTEQAPGERVVARRHAFPRGGDEQLIEVGAAERAGGHLRRSAAPRPRRARRPGVYRCTTPPPNSATHTPPSASTVSPSGLPSSGRPTNGRRPVRPASRS